MLMTVDRWASMTDAQKFATPIEDVCVFVDALVALVRLRVSEEMTTQLLDDNAAMHDALANATRDLLKVRRHHEDELEVVRHDYDQMWCECSPRQVDLWRRDAPHVVEKAIANHNRLYHR